MASTQAAACARQGWQSLPALVGTPSSPSQGSSCGWLLSRIAIAVPAGTTWEHSECSLHLQGNLNKERWAYLELTPLHSFLQTNVFFPTVYPRFTNRWSLWGCFNPPVGCPGGHGTLQFYCSWIQPTWGRVLYSPTALCFAAQMYLLSYLALISGIRMTEWENEAHHPQPA